jgi:hypothetical protein
LYNAAILQARDQDELARISISSVPSAKENTASSIPQGIQKGKQDPNPRTSDAPERPPPSPEMGNLKHALGSSDSSELPPIGKDRDWQPEAWTPQTARKRGG